MKRGKEPCPGQQIAREDGEEKGSDRKETGCGRSPPSLLKNTENHLEGLILSPHTRLRHIGREIVLDLASLHKQM